MFSIIPQDVKLRYLVVFLYTLVFSVSTDGFLVRIAIRPSSVRGCQEYCYIISSKFLRCSTATKKNKVSMTTRLKGLLVRQLVEELFLVATKLLEGGLSGWATKIKNAAPLTLSKIY